LGWHTQHAAAGVARRGRARLVRGAGAHAAAGALPRRPRDQPPAGPARHVLVAGTHGGAVGAPADPRAAGGQQAHPTGGPPDEVRASRGS
jgi:hypothetical protein